MNVRAETQTTALGRYTVVKRLANGGMADVLLARTDGIEGFERHVVIKRIHAELLEEPRYVRMFLDEARLAASLHHHNIVQVNDIGQQAGEFFFAMEYVHGEDARTLLVTASERGTQIPLEHVITIICAAAAGLHHAHEQCAADRTPLGIVHRDVSPANILVGFDGSVKVADFGIALAAHRSEQTQSGVLKGKVAYMSPEQCNCEKVDRRSDVFALGVCLYELATVHPCFAAENDFLTMSAIVAGRFTPPSHLSAAVTPALEKIILKALARDVTQRYQSADELRQALEQYAVSANIRNSTAALADYMKAQFGTRALPWQDAANDEEPDIEVVLMEPHRHPPLNQQSRSIIVDEDLAIPIEGSRPIKETLPLRPFKLLPPDITPADGARVEQAIARLDSAIARSVPASPDVAPVPAAATIEQPQAVLPLASVPAISRRLWLAGGTLVLLLVSIGWLLSASTDTPRSAARVEAPSRPHVAPLARPKLEVPFVEATAEPVATAVPSAPATPSATPKKSGRKPAKQKAAAKPTTKKWDPDALFPN